jgi:hypothetical protein
MENNFISDLYPQIAQISADYFGAFLRFAVVGAADFIFAVTLAFILTLSGRGGRDSAGEGDALNLRKSAQSVDNNGI